MMQQQQQCVSDVGYVYQKVQFFLNESEIVSLFSSSGLACQSG